MEYLPGAMRGPMFDEIVCVYSLQSNNLVPLLLHILGLVRRIWAGRLEARKA